MSSLSPVVFKGRLLGIVAVVLAQILIGLVHVFSGAYLLVAGNAGTLFSSMGFPRVYEVYTLLFGLSTLIFAYGIWASTGWGWIGTETVSVFVIVVDALALLNLPSIPGIPKFAGALEISYSLIILLYLLQSDVKRTFFESE